MMILSHLKILHYRESEVIRGNRRCDFSVSIRLGSPELEVAFLTKYLFLRSYAAAMERKLLN